MYIVEKLVTCTLKKTERLIGTNQWLEANQMFCVVRVDSQSVNKLLEIRLGRDCSVVGKKIASAVTKCSKYNISLRGRQ